MIAKLRPTSLRQGYDLASTAAAKARLRLSGLAAGRGDAVQYAVMLTWVRATA